MDTITHGIAGALISKAVCHGDDLFSTRAMTKQRIVTWSLMIGAIFPDADTIRDMLSKNEMLMITWHRSITHSLVCLPLWALMLAALTRWIAKRFKWESNSYAALVGIYALGILSHIFLDLVTSFGTMIWSPLQWSRPAWDIIFIIDFSLSALLLLPQFLSWAYQDHERHKKRVLVLWVILLPIPLLIALFARSVGTPISPNYVAGAVVLISAAFLIPALAGWGVRVRHVSWNRAGLLATACYILAAFYAHHAALERVKQFAVLENLDTTSIGALPFPPSLWHWDGLVNTDHGVYEIKMDLSDSTSSFSNSGSSPIAYSFYPDAFPNRWTAAAQALPEVQKVLWFSRFPVTRFRKEGETAVVEISDLRFPKIRPDRPASFTYRVEFAEDGTVLFKGWAKRNR
jgi:membrane-bound metal-dependent hydrolase YbcI (DUF457 family)